MPASASRSPPFSSGKVYLGRLSRSISRRVSSGVRARVMSLDSPPNGIAFPCTPPFISWSMVCVGVLGLPGAAAFAGGAFPSALSSARALWTAPSTAMADNMIPACFIAPLLRKRKRPRQGSRLAFRPRTQGKGLPWIVGRQPEVRSKPTTRAGGAAGGCPNNPMLDRSFRLSVPSTRAGPGTQLALRVPRFHQYQWR